MEATIFKEMNNSRLTRAAQRLSTLDAGRSQSLLMEVIAVSESPHQRLRTLTFYGVLPSPVSIGDWFR